MCQSGKTRSIYRDVHKGPVTSLVLIGKGKEELLVTGSWDQSIAFWNTTVSRASEIISPCADSLKVWFHRPKTAFVE